MSDQLDRTEPHFPSPIKLWSPMVITVVTFLFGLIAGLALVSMNCLRMGRTTRVFGYIYGGIATFFLVPLVSLLIDDMGLFQSVMGLAVGLMGIFPDASNLSRIDFWSAVVLAMAAFSLYFLSKYDIAYLPPSNRKVEYASPIFGVGVGVGVLLLILVGTAMLCSLIFVLLFPDGFVGE
jgi:hypothetical protein